MFIIYGRKSARIKSDTYHQYACGNCKDFDLDVHVYRPYFHVFFLPLFPAGPKEVKMRCNNCGEAKWVASIQRQYEKTSRTPFYLYGGVLLVAAMVLLGVIFNLRSQRQNKAFVADPRVGDVYTVRREEKDSTFYYFLKIHHINGDTVRVYHNNLVYYSSVSRFNEKDFFVEREEWMFSKKDLGNMLQKNEIENVSRDYGVYEGFNRIE